MTRGGTILLVEDEEDIASLVRTYLERDGFRVLWTSKGTEGLLELERNEVRLAILDLQLPDTDGFDLCRAIRSCSRLPIVMLTARDEEVDRVTGLELGADDYVTKPFSPRELVARVSAVLRRVRPALAAEHLAYDDVEMDVGAHRVRRSGQPVALGPTEFRLLKHFLEYPGRVFSRERLLDSVWSHDPDIDARTVDVHIRRLRQALNGDDRPDIIRTVRAAGYSLDAEP